MPSYLVERTFSVGAGAAADSAAAGFCDAVIRADGCEGVTWVQSFVTPDRRRSYCVVDAASPEVIRVAAQATALPVDRITEVRVLDPHALSMPPREFWLPGGSTGESR
ncbi:MAG: nickel-binding protein [Rubrivivax sp.]